MEKEAVRRDSDPFQNERQLQADQLVENPQLTYGDIEVYIDEAEMSLDLDIISSIEKCIVNALEHPHKKDLSYLYKFFPKLGIAKQRIRKSLDEKRIFAFNSYQISNVKQFVAHDGSMLSL